MNTSVLIFFGSIPGPRQNDPVSLSNKLTLTIQSSVVIAFRTLNTLALLTADHPPGEKAGESPFVHLIEKGQPRVIDAVIQFGR